MIKEFEKYMAEENTPAMRKNRAEEARASFDSWYRSLPEAEKNELDKPDTDYWLSEESFLKFLREHEDKISEKDWDELAFFGDKRSSYRNLRQLEIFRSEFCNLIVRGTWRLLDAVEEVFADESGEAKVLAVSCARWVCNVKSEEMSLAEMLELVRDYCSQKKVVLNFDPELARPIINGMSTWDAEDFCRHIAGVTDDEQKLISDIFDEVEVEELLPDDDYDRDDVDYDEDDHHSAVSYENVDYDWDDYHRRAGENMHRLADFLTRHGFVVEDESGYLQEDA